MGICTCRNPTGLKKLLERLGPASVTLRPAEVVVVDNDPKAEGIAVVEELRDTLPFPVRTFIEDRAGIPFARNRIIREALEFDFDYLLMVDDDEYPAEGWLEAMVITAASTGADVVGGPVRPAFDEPPPPPIRPMDYSKPGGRTVGSRTLVESTANVLLSRSLLERCNGRWFREDFTASGGSDSEFFRRTAAEGATHAVAPMALVFEDIAASRANASWLVRRAYSRGNVMTRVRALRRGFAVAALIELPNICGLLSVAALKVLPRPWNRRARLEARLKLARAMGKLSALGGGRYLEYTPERYR